MIGNIVSKSAAAAAAIAGAVMLSGAGAAPAVADTKLRIFLGIPGITYWAGPGYYQGKYRSRLSCNEGRRLVDNSGFNNVKAVDCTPRYYRYDARRNGKKYRVRVDECSGNLTFHRI